MKRAFFIILSFSLILSLTSSQLVYAMANEESIAREGEFEKEIYEIEAVRAESVSSLKHLHREVAQKNLTDSETDFNFYYAHYTKDSQSKRYILFRSILHYD